MLCSRRDKRFSLIRGRFCHKEAQKTHYFIDRGSGCRKEGREGIHSSLSRASHRGPRVPPPHTRSPECVFSQARWYVPSPRAGLPAERCGTVLRAAPFASSPESAALLHEGKSAATLPCHLTNRRPQPCPTHLHSM